VIDRHDEEAIRNKSSREANLRGVDSAFTDIKE
jgi:hypothetical protein